MAAAIYSALVFGVLADPAPLLRPPAVPLIAHDPYFSIWSPADKLTDADTVHWTGKPNRLTSLVRIDGKPFRIIGKAPAKVPALPQTRLEVLPTRTIYTFEGEGVQLKLTFMTPALPDDLMVCSRPVTYVTWDTKSLDGKRHEFRALLDVNPEIVVNEPSQMICIEPVFDKRTLRAGSVDQAVLVRKGDDVRQDWGHLYIHIRDSLRFEPGILNADNARAAFAAAKYDSLTNLSSSIGSPREKVESLAFNVRLPDFGGDQQASASNWLLLAYDDEFSIKYFRSKLRPYWRRNGDNAAELVQKASEDYPMLLKRCAEFDEQLMSSLRKVGGEKYAQLCALAYRQTFAGNKIVADANGKPLMFPKENFSNGCIGTVDVLFPQAPFFLVFSPALTKAMLTPILDYAASPRWPYGYAPHDLGTYPHATGQVYGMNGKDGDRMPVEESGNMLIMLAAVAKCEGNADFSKPYAPMLAKWADYLVKEGLDPQNQLCSADMFGHLPRSANLALKAVIAIGGYAQLCEMSGKPEDAAKYGAIAQNYAAKWMDLAKDDGRTRLAYHLPNTWAMKHNLIWDRVLGLNLFPESVGDAEVAWYLKVQKKYGLPVDNRTDTSLIDWALWSIALARNDKDFQALLEPIYNYANETPSRVPLSDWFATTDAKQKGFQARSVVGGVFVKMLTDPSTWSQWAKQAPAVNGPWAAIPISGTIRELAPTSREQPVLWRYTMNEPPQEWFKRDFNDVAWKEGSGGFGTAQTPGSVVRTEWKTSHIWLRREFSLTERRLRSPRLMVHYDEDATVYVNGVMAAQLPGWTSGYDEFEISREAAATLRPGKNVMAIHCQQTYGGQYIDVGLIDDAPSAPPRRTRH